MQSTRRGTGTIRANACCGDTSWEDGIEPLLKGFDSWTRGGHRGRDVVEVHREQLLPRSFLRLTPIFGTSRPNP